MAVLADEMENQGKFGFLAARPETWKERFDLFDAQNPDVYREFRRLARHLRRKGLSRYSAVGIVAVIRFNRTIRTTGDDAQEFKINNNFIAFYARKLIDEDPTFADFFELREMKIK